VSPTGSAPGGSAQPARTYDRDTGATAALPSMRTEPRRAAGRDDGIGQRIGAEIGSSADVSCPVVKRRFVSHGRLMMAQDMRAFLSADVYFKPGTVKYCDSLLQARRIGCIAWRCRVGSRCPPSDDSRRSKWKER
jgi:hypothetical protein